MTTTTDSISIQAAKEHPLPQYSRGQQIGGYEVAEKLDEGMLGAVYKVKHSKTGQVVALKLLRPQLLAQGMNVDRFSHEVQLLRSVTHPGLVELYDAGEQDGVLFFTMEFVPGKSLRALLTEYQSKGADMPRREMLDILTGLLEVLDELHPANLHRNLKPENILVVETKQPDGKVKRQVKLTDLALAKVVSLAESSLDREGAWYLAPEMSEFRDKATPSSDLYSVGAIFYEMLTGYPPIGRYELPSQVLEHGVSETVDDLVEIALAPNPQDRFQTAEDMLAALEETFSDYYGAGDTNMKRVLLLLGVLVVVAAAAAVYFQQSAPTEQQLIDAQAEHRLAVLAEVAAGQEESPTPAVSDPKYDDMVWIPAGPYVAGDWSVYNEEARAGQRIEAIVRVNGYWIDKYELHSKPKDVPETDEPEVAAEKEAWNAEYGWAVEYDRTWREAKALCEQLGKRLCTEDEWEKACKGPDNWIYTYGDDPISGKCPESGFAPRHVDVEHADCKSGYDVVDLANKHEKCKSGYEVFNMGGGVTEWTATPDYDHYVVKPGAVGSDLESTACAGRFDRAPNFAQIHVGVRCCAN